MLITKSDDERLKPGENLRGWTNIDVDSLRAVREDCAKVAIGTYMDLHRGLESQEIHDIAAAIRGRVRRGRIYPFWHVFT
jgi:hypothetical protein